MEALIVPIPTGTVMATVSSTSVNDDVSKNKAEFPFEYNTWDFIIIRRAHKLLIADCRYHLRFKSCF